MYEFLYDPHNMILITKICMYITAVFIFNYVGKELMFKYDQRAATGYLIAMSCAALIGLILIDAP